MPNVTPQIQFLRGETFHGRHGPIQNKFRYKMDSILVPAGEPAAAETRLLRRNKFGLFSFYDKDHGDGDSIHSFAKKIIETQDLSAACDGDIWLLTQPRFCGYIFNPVSFWFFQCKEKHLRVVMAEVNNTDGGRHFYLCHHDDFRAIEREDQIKVEKIFHVSPFQGVAGEYRFKFLFSDSHIGTWIDHRNGDEGVYATYTGRVFTLTGWQLIKSAFRRPFGALRVITLIHWQALKLKLKGGIYRSTPEPHSKRISR